VFAEETEDDDGESPLLMRCCGLDRPRKKTEPLVMQGSDKGYVSELECAALFDD
jgi:hypothetical protein